MSKGEAARRRALSVRLRLMLPIVIAIAGMLVLGTLEVGRALDTNTDAARARVIAGLAEKTAELLQNGQGEVAATIQSHNEGSGDERLQKFFDKTDKDASSFLDQAHEVSDLVPELEPLVLTADGSLDRTDDARAHMEEYVEDTDVPRSDPEVDNGFELYQSIADRVLDVGDALHQYISDRGLAEQVRALGALSGAKQMTGNQRFLVSNMLGEAEKDGENKIPEPALTEVATLHGIEEQRLGEFYRAAEPSAKAIYAKELSAPSTKVADQAIRSLLQGGSVDFEAAEWDDYQAKRIEHLHTVQSGLTEHLRDSVDDLETEARTNAFITGGVVLVISGLTFTAAMIFAVRISRRLRVLRHNALSIAEEELPSAVASMTEAGSERQVSEVSQAAQSQAASVTGRGPNDEIAGVSAAFEVVHRQAVRLAADQATLRIDVAAMMVALARRGQSLVHRQLHMLNEFTDVERDHSALERMRALQHVGARMRRNDENLLLLAGGDPGRRYQRPISLGRAVTEAAGEIEDSTRVVVEDAADTLIKATAVGDIVHLLAELLENAAAFSPPHSRVRVATRRTMQEAVISISDEGIGAPPDQVSEINERLSEPSNLTSSLAGTMGLLVVGRLAARRGIEVRLHSTAGKGTLAVVRLPDSLIHNDPDTDGGDHFDYHAMAESYAVASSPSALAPVPEPEAGPVTGTGDAVPAQDSTTAIVPQPRTPRAVPSEAPVSGSPQQTGWFMPATGSGDVPAPSPGALSWQSGAGDRAYDEAQQAIAAAETVAEQPHDGSLPRRQPGSALVPGSVDMASSSPSAGRSGPSSSSAAGTGKPPGDSLDPDEIRIRLAGFAGGIAAAAEASVDSRWPVDES